jgi:hypothetical protein
MGLFSGTIMWMIVTIVAGWFILRHVDASSPEEKKTDNKK